VAFTVRHLPPKSVPYKQRMELAQAMGQASEALVLPLDFRPLALQTRAK
jgi:hypothetical protein